MTTPREKQIVRATKARAIITAFLNNWEGADPVTLGTLIELPGIKELKINAATMHRILRNMVLNQLIKAVDINVPGRYKMGYTAIGAGETNSKVKVVHHKQPKNSKSIPLDITVNEKTGALGIIWGGLNVTIRKV